MKKILLLMIVVLLCGCTIEKVNTENHDKAIDAMVKAKFKFVNTISNGVKYYLPFGVKKIDSKKYNDVLEYNKDVYYLYFDATSYLYKSKVNYEVNKEVYFSEKIKDSGYIEITKIKDKYFIEAMYNYCKIETYVKEQNLSQTIINIMYILKSVQFNDYIIKLNQNSKDLAKEEKLNIFTPTIKDQSFLEYIEEFGNYKGEIIIENELGKESE